MDGRKDPQNGIAAYSSWTRVAPSRLSGWALVLGLWLAALPALAQDASADKRLSLTIYNSNLALIEHVRPLRVAAGTHRIEFAGVSAQILPQTVSFSGPELSILEQNFDYDLLTPQKLMEKAIGQQVRIVRTNPATGQETPEIAEVLSTAGGVVLRIGDRIEVLREDGIPARVIFDEVPPNLRASPTLSILANAARAVDGDVTLAYLTRGLSWNADYVAVFDEAQGQTSLQGWITLRNDSGTTFENVQMQLVAGDINVVNNEAQWWQAYNQRRNNNRNVRRAAGVEPSAREQLADYYVYPIAQTTTVANSQTKQLSFLTAERVRADKGYEQTFYTLQSQDEPVSAEVRVRFSNSQASGLGDQLPSGVVRVYARDARGQPQFIGEDRLGHTSAGSELALKTGDAFDVTIQPTLRETRSAGRRETDFTMSYLVRNARPEPVTVTIRQENLWRFNEVRSESHRGRRTDADSFAWDVPLPANGETELTFTIRQRW
jgi:hypothetical protein